MDTITIAENIEQQLLEIEMVEAMFPGKEELQMDDECTIEDVRKWMLATTNSKNIEYLPPRISFKLCIFKLPSCTTVDAAAVSFLSTGFIIQKLFSGVSNIWSVIANPLVLK